MFYVQEKLTTDQFMQLFLALYIRPEGQSFVECVKDFHLAREYYRDNFDTMQNKKLHEAGRITNRTKIDKWLDII